MESKRQQKFARLIQKELAEIFQRDVSHLFQSTYISVSGVAVSPDLGVAKVHLSLLLNPKGRDLLNEIKVNTKTIRHELAKRIKNQVRVIPELIFYLDDTAEYAAKMDKIISELDIPSESKEDPTNPFRNEEDYYLSDEDGEDDEEDADGR
ncbi:30S ribosome-binding factor RbfA [Rufibacter latericius]|uniref:Ribosome-binding factor A n=1 Tax=Rufibacter latericius TaxID=2487040 RepID=A0A3M9MFR3_9BACT|nr:30S ribosome-binding factor RbfA [Rufibacter latericius]RNI23713.1 30S ribosome-binding factor RbfA [Rufibacter latericius]